MAQSALLAGPKGAEVEVEADRIVYTWQPPVIRLEGHVVARRGGGVLRAGSGTLDRERGILKLEGGVLGIQGRQVLLADAAVVDLNARNFVNLFDRAYSPLTLLIFLQVRK